jgi:hypothetical protein
MTPLRQLKNCISKRTQNHAAHYRLPACPVYAGPLYQFRIKTNLLQYRALAELLRFFCLPPNPPIGVLGQPFFSVAAPWDIHVKLVRDCGAGLYGTEGAPATNVPRIGDRHIHPCTQRSSVPSSDWPSRTDVDNGSVITFGMGRFTTE